MFRPQSRLALHGIMVIAALILSGGSGFAAEDPESANNIMPGCRNIVTGTDMGRFISGVCLGFISGVRYRSQEVCEPDGISRMNKRFASSRNTSTPALRGCTRTSRNWRLRP